MSIIDAVKIIFDRSAFHRDRFDLIKGSRLSQLTEEGRILVFHTVTFLEETLRMTRSGKQNAKAELKRQWPFLQSICNGGWFYPLLFGDPPKLRSVCDVELSGSPREISWPIVPTFVRSNSEAKFNKLVEESVQLPELNNAVPIWDENEHKKKLGKALLVDLRNRHMIQKNENFEQYYQSQADSAAYLHIHKTLALSEPQVKLVAWRNNPQNFPHFTACLRNTIFGMYDAERNQSASLDLNWLDDAEQLCFLVDVDAIVSSDQAFMKRAFDELWKPKGKRMFTPEEFVAVLD
jgi:hypothetical protein